MALTQISTDGIKNGTISSADLGSNLKVTGSLFEVENTGGNANFEVTKVSGANFRIQSQSSLVRLDTIGASHPIMLGTNGNGRIQINDSTVDLLNDNQRLRIGASNDLQIFHDGSHSRLNSATGMFNIQSDDFRVTDAANSLTAFKIDPDGATDLRYNGSVKLQTTSTGATLTGTLLATTIDIPDSGYLRLGTGDDLQIYHNGSGSFIDAYTTDLEIRNSNTELMAEFRLNNAVDLYYDGTKRLSTHSQGAIVNGHTLYIRGASNEDARLFFIANNSASYNDHYSLNVAATGAFAIQTEVNANQFENLITATQHGNVELFHDNSKRFETTGAGVLVSGSLTADGGNAITLGDNKKIVLGTGSDLQIYHDGNHSYIQDAGTGALILVSNQVVMQNAAQTENMFAAIENAGCNLYYDNVKKFETTSSGAEVFGELQMNDANSHIKIPDNARIDIGNSNDLQIYHNATANTNEFTSPKSTNFRGKNLYFYVGANVSSEQAIMAYANQGVELYYDNNKKFETTSSGIDLPTGGSEITFLGSGTCRHSIQSPSGSNDVVITANKLAQNVTANIIFKSSGAGGGSVTEKCRIDGNGHFIPGSSNNFDLGTSTDRWRNLYTNDLNLSNEGSSNDVDGTWGSYTIQEGAESLFLINKRNGKKYKFNLTEVS